MTMTEAAPTTRATRAIGQDSDGPPMIDQVVLSGAGLASQGITGVRRTLDGAITALDALVTGAFDVADQVIESTLVAEMTAKGLAAGRRSWTTAVETARTTVASV